MWLPARCTRPGVLNAQALLAPCAGHAHASVQGALALRQPSRKPHWNGPGRPDFACLPRQHTHRKSCSQRPRAPDPVFRSVHLANISLDRSFLHHLRPALHSPTPHPPCTAPHMCPHPTHLHHTCPHHTLQLTCSCTTPRTTTWTAFCTMSCATLTFGHGHPEWHSPACAPHSSSYVPHSGSLHQTRLHHIHPAPHPPAPHVHYTVTSTSLHYTVHCYCTALACTTSALHHSCPTLHSHVPHAHLPCSTLHHSPAPHSCALHYTRLHHICACPAPHCTTLGCSLFALQHTCDTPQRTALACTTVTPAPRTPANTRGRRLKGSRLGQIWHGVRQILFKLRCLPKGTATPPGFQLANCVHKKEAKRVRFLPSLPSLSCRTQGDFLLLIDAVSTDTRTGPITFQCHE